MTNTVLKAQIDSQITNETLPSSISPTDVGGNLKAVVDYIDQEVPYTSYTAMLSQISTDAPTVTLLKNEANLTVTLTRTSLGKYKATLSSPIDRAKTPVIIGSGALYFINSAAFQSTTIINIFTFDITAGTVTYYDGRLDNTFFEIRIYN